MSSKVIDDMDFGPEPKKDPTIPEGQMTIEDLLDKDLDELVPPSFDEALIVEDMDQYLEVVAPDELPEIPKRAITTHAGIDSSPQEASAILTALNLLADLVQVETRVSVAVDSVLGSVIADSVKEPVIQHILMQAQEIAQASEQSSVYLKVKSHIVDVGQLLEYLSKHQMTADQFVEKVHGLKNKAFPNP